MGGDNGKGGNFNKEDWEKYEKALKKNKKWFAGVVKIKYLFLLMMMMMMYLLII
tara:strand:+ start:145 stop:306 length:162 start_codon:yes stop_codon:yes gene_type:complete